MQTACPPSLHIPDPDSSSMFLLNHHRFQLMELKMKVQAHLMKLNMRGHWEMVFEEHQPILRFENKIFQLVQEELMRRRTASL